MALALAQTLYSYISPHAKRSFDHFLLHNASLVGTLIHSGGCYVDVARNQLVRQSIQHGVTHTLFVDADMILPLDAAEKLMARKLPVVGGLYFSRAYPHPPVAYEGFGKEFRPIEQWNELRTVDVVGMGCTLIENKVFVAMQEKFDDQWWFNTDRNIGGEDVWFCQRCKELGISVHVDPDVQCGHITDTSVTELHFRHAKEEQCQLASGR